MDADTSQNCNSTNEKLLLENSASEAEIKKFEKIKKIMSKPWGGHRQKKKRQIVAFCRFLTLF